MFFMFDKDNAEKMFGYRVRFLGPEDDENEDICYAYRHIPQKDKQSTQPIASIKEIVHSPKVTFKNNLGSPLNAVGGNLLQLKAPINRKAPQIKLIFQNEVTHIAKRYIQMINYFTVRLKRVPSALDEEEEAAASPTPVSNPPPEGNSPKKQQSKHKKFQMAWLFFEPMTEEELNNTSPNKQLRK